jgi:transcriptional regulator with XRE-family HTH domain
MSLPKETEVLCRSLARELRRRRLATGLSMNQLAERSGLSQPMIGFIEKGTCSPTAASLFRISIALDCPLADIFNAVAGAPLPPLPPDAGARSKI